MDSNEIQDVSIYVELLPNIRRMVLIILLPSPPTASSTVHIFREEVPRVSVQHQGVTTEALLPARPLASLELLRGSKMTTSELVFRVLFDAGSVAGLLEAEAEVPWSAGTLQAGAAVRCRGCGGTVVAEDRIKEWKDLPSENWAEMMEFWHCHKPDHHHQHGHANGHDDPSDGLASRGYGANSVLTAQRGVGFVDLMTFLFERDDCCGITISPTPSVDRDASSTETSTDEGAVIETTNGGRPRTQDISCSSCNSRLGYFNLRTQAATLFKWQIVCAASTPAQPSVSECLTSALAAAFAQSGSAKSLLMPLDDDGSDVVLHVWVLNQRIRFTSTSVPGRALPAMKVMWRVVTVAEAEKILEPMLAREQEVNLPSGAIAAVRVELEASNLMYPEHDRAFQGWKSGLLRSWEGSSSSS